MSGARVIDPGPIQLQSVGVWTRLGRWLLGILLLGLVVALWLAFFMLRARPVSWAGAQGVVYSGSGGFLSRTYSFRSRSSDIIAFPRYSFWRHELVYYSPKDNAICVVDRERTARWLSLSGYVLAGWSVKEMTPLSTGVLLSLYLEKDPAMRAVLRVDLTTNSMIQVEGAAEAKAGEHSADIAVLTGNGEIEIRSGTQRSVVPLRGMTISDWDFDPGQENGSDGPVVAAGDWQHGMLAIARGNRVRRWRLRWLARPNGVFLMRSIDEVWLSFERPWGKDVVLAYTLKGRYAGTREQFESPINRPMVLMDREKRSLLRRLEPDLDGKKPREGDWEARGSVIARTAPWGWF